MKLFDLIWWVCFRYCVGLRNGGTFSCFDFNASCRCSNSSLRMEKPSRFAISRPTWGTEPGLLAFSSLFLFIYLICCLLLKLNKFCNLFRGRCFCKIGQGCNRAMKTGFICKIEHLCFGETIFHWLLIFVWRTFYCVLWWHQSNF